MNLNAHDNLSEFTIAETACLICGVNPPDTNKSVVVRRTLEFLETGYLNAIEYVKKRKSTDSSHKYFKYFFSWRLRSFLYEKIKLFEEFDDTLHPNEIPVELRFDMWRYDLERYISHTENSVENQFFSRDEIHRWLIANDINSLYDFSHKTESTKSKHNIELSYFEFQASLIKTVSEVVVETLVSPVEGLNDLSGAEADATLNSDTNAMSMSVVETFVSPLEGNDLPGVEAVATLSSDIALINECQLKNNKIDLLIPLETTQIASCFDGFKWSEDRWKKNLGNKPLWVRDSIVTNGIQGKSQIKWDPVEIGSVLVREKYATIDQVRKRFKNKIPLQPWLERWNCKVDSILDSLQND